MGSLVIFKGQVPPLTPEQKARLAALSDIRDEDIDLSDIPDLRDDERGKYVRARDKKDLWKQIKVRVVKD